MSQEIEKGLSGNSNPVESASMGFEKLYLHLDRNYYASGDDIWFKAYLVNALDNKLSGNSCCLYVELISPELKIIKREAILLKNGMGDGDFHLRDSLPSGKYLIRAYTRWMQNFGEYFFFKKEVHVENVLGITNTVPKHKFPEETKPQVDVQFFPEGGSLIENVCSTVGVKAIDQAGKGCNIRGIVSTDSGDTIASFESTYLGMGRFKFVPKSGTNYYAIGSTDNGLKFKVLLPVALKNGYVFNVMNPDSTIMQLGIRTNMETFQRDLGKEMLLVGTIRGSVSLTAKIVNRTIFNYLRIPQENLPEGVIKLTLFDSENKPQCERLAFIHHDRKPAIHIVTEKSNYASRERTELKISVRDSINRPMQANLSLSVIDRKQAGNQSAYSSKIDSYFLLESDLKGRIEQPAKYFDPENTDRFKELDLLLLTQGWSDFVWKHLADSTLKISHYPEKGICVSGRLRRLLTNKPIVNANISLALFNEGKLNFMSLAATDSTGKYYFNPLFFSGEQNLIVSATNRKNRSVGWISLDSIFGVPAPIHPLNLSEPAIYSPKLSTLREEAMQRYNINQYSLKDNIRLAEVLVTAKKEEDKNDDRGRIYGIPDCSIKVTDKDAAYSDVFQLMQGRVAGLFISGVYPNISISIRGSRQNPLFLLDGSPADIEEISSLPVSVIDKVDVLKNAGNLALFGVRGANGVISIYTKTGSSVSNSSPVYNSINTKVDGFYFARTFYSPKYDDPNQGNRKPDLRATICWQPNVITDKDGNATVTFFNADNATDVDICLEGISSYGDPLKATSTYHVISVR